MQHLFDILDIIVIIRIFKVTMLMLDKITFVITVDRVETWRGYYIL